MNCLQKVQYTIRRGDNLYQLSRYFQTTVQEILALNPGIDPYNLQIGRSIIICPGEQFVSQAFPSDPPACPNTSMQFNLLGDMREAWIQHIYWTRLLLISIANRLADQGATTARLLENPADIAAIFANFYSPATAGTIEQLLTEHLTIGSDLITALRDDQTAEAEALTRRWYQNADQLAEALSSINPFYSIDEVQRMLYDHLDLTTQEVEARLANDFEVDIAAFNRVEQEALSMADYFSSGIMRQFPQQFM